MDKRVYDGQLSDELQEHLDFVQSELESLKKVVPDAHVTYFPMEQDWIVFANLEQISGRKKSKLAAIRDAVERRESYISHAGIEMSRKLSALSGVTNEQTLS